MIETTLDLLTVSLFGICDYLRWIGQFHCFGPIKTFRQFADLEWFGHVRWIGQTFWQFGHYE